MPSDEPVKNKRHGPSAWYTVLFVLVLCLVAALVLSVVAMSTRYHQMRAQQLDLAKRILASAQIYNQSGYFQMLDSSGSWVPAKWEQDQEGGRLVPGSTSDTATAEQIYEVFALRLVPLLTDSQGHVSTFAAAQIHLQDYLDANSKKGFSQLPQKLFYLLWAQDDQAASKTVGGYIFPIDGFGLWGAIYGYIAVKPDADTVIGTSWYAPQETPGLGAIIQDPKWQAQFDGKLLFRPGPSGATDFASAPLGIVVIRGKVADRFGNRPAGRNAVDGISGATLTGDGVTNAFHTSLAPYRPLLLEIQQAYSDHKPPAFVTEVQGK